MSITAEDVTWDLEPLVDGRGEAGVDEQLDRAAAIADELKAHRGRVGELDATGLASFMARLGELQEQLGLAGSYAGLRFVTDVTDAQRAALMQRVEERSTTIGTELVFFELEWAALDDDAVDTLLGDDALAPYRHFLRSARRYRPYLLTEPEEKILIEKSVTGPSAWARLFGELISTIEVEVDGAKTTLEEGLSRLHAPDREVRRQAAEAVTAALDDGLRTRTFIFNTLLLDKGTDDRLRGYPHWLAFRNLQNEASDESVDALVKAVRSRYDIAQRWYTLKREVLGYERLYDYDRYASIAVEEAEFGWDAARDLVLDAYTSFSPDMANVAKRFFDERWIDAPARPGKRGGAFCAYTVPSHHPYVLLNWTARRNDVLTLAHELGHGVHAYLARPQGVFHQTTPLTLAETASVFGETVTFGRLLSMTTDPTDRLALLAENLESTIATVFRQTAMNRFEDLTHSARREEGELSGERIGDLWIDTQREMLGDSVEFTDGYRSWWSYIPHFIDTPGYVYAYAYGQLLALAVYHQYELRGSDFVPQYLQLLAAGGSMSPEDLGRLVDCDLADPSFWDGGLAIVEGQLKAAEEAAVAAGRVTR